jgi:hypothetical protein
MPPRPENVYGRGFRTDVVITRKPAFSPRPDDRGRKLPPFLYVGAHRGKMRT